MYETDFVIGAECLPEAITCDFYIHWTSFKSLYREDGYGTFTGESGATYYCDWTYKFQIQSNKRKRWHIFTINGPPG